MSFAHLTIATRNAQRSSQFFQNTFLWQPIHQPGNIDLTAAWLEIAPGQQIHILQIADFEPSPFEAEFGRHVAVFHPSADFAALKQRLIANGATLVDAIRETPFERFFFRDPNGYMFEVIDREGYVTE